MKHLFRRIFLRMGALGFLGSIGSIGSSKIAGAETLEGAIFKQEVIGILRRHHPDWHFKDDDDPMVIAIEDNRISLENIFLIVRSMSDREREETILGFIEAAFVSQDVPLPEKMPYDEAKSRLLLQIIPAEYKDQVPNLISRPFFSHLNVGYALDEEKRYDLLFDPVLAAWNINQEELEAQALANLEVSVAGQELFVKKGEEGSYVFLAADDSFAAARLLLPGFMKRVREALDAPRIFVGIPNRDFALAWTPDFSGRRGFAEKIRRDLASEPYPLTDELFVSSADGVRPATAEEAGDHGM